jgi:hypothetical protein
MYHHILRRANAAANLFNVPRRSFLGIILGLISVGLRQSQGFVVRSWWYCRPMRCSLQSQWDCN